MNRQSFVAEHFPVAMLQAVNASLNILIGLYRQFPHTNGARQLSLLLLVVEDSAIILRYQSPYFELVTRLRQTS